MRKHFMFLLLMGVMALLILSAVAFATNGGGSRDGSSQNCSPEQIEEDITKCPGYWATFSDPGQAEPDPPPGEDTYDGTTEEIEPEPTGSSRNSSQLLLSSCKFEAQGDNPHNSRRPTGSVSVHGWWNDLSYYNEGSCPETGLVTVKLQGYWCIWSDPSRFCWYRTLVTESQTITARNLSHKRVNARVACTRSDRNYRYRNVTKAEVGGDSETKRRWADVDCRHNYN